jgi:hypothetical protein
MSRRTLACTAAIIAILGAGTACQPDKTTGSSGSTATATATTDSKPSTQKTVPNFVGMGLQSAQDAAQAAGFYTLKSHDALGHSRHQVLDRNWKVCDQNVKAGAAASTDTRLDFGAVKLDETCPANTQTTATETPTPTPTAKPTPTPTRHTAAPKPAAPAPAPAHTSAPPVDDHGGATALCNDGTLSYSAHHQGTCSHHHGVAVWYK